ncbi:CYTH and CHAD domain-containing protein [Streptomyces sp. ISL-10]|uniref:CYTH and CHAD domain-containing protein n=1 Tax=Streptomyces sp. ISL-10 TaxID=2819172 RepID=UPI001BEAF2BB|nr:CYTH and CHAD domain-containing protein [Streptomyces sp. ISL-10]MBT2368348.1 CYTH and CHAD domain-containing protein [Streptomyces sp. ISL-10]
MADTKREIERKYDADADTRLPDLTRVSEVADVRDRGVDELDAVYYDTGDLRLAAASVTLRRRTGGADAGWHLKLPVAPEIRDEISAPLSDDIPGELRALVRVYTRDAELAPVVRLRSVRNVRHLLDADGALLAEVSRDEVHAERPPDGGRTARWDEIEVELADGGDPALLDAVDKRLRKAGLHKATAPSKLARALAETGTAPASRPAAPPPRTAGDHILGYLREQADALVSYDPGVRRDLPDAVHQMRVATRRLRSALRTYRKILDREVTRPVTDELTWLAGELGVARDQEVLAERLRSRVDALPDTLLLGPVAARLKAWAVAAGSDARGTALAALDSTRYLDLLSALDALLEEPPLLKAAGKAADAALPDAVLKEYDRLSRRVEHALALPAGGERDVALHDARKAAKRTRYAAEAAAQALGRPARQFAKRMKAVQKVLGDHQDSVVARHTLRDLAIRADAAGESAFTWGLLYGQESARAAEREAELPQVWERATGPGLRAALTG